MLGLLRCRVSVYPKHSMVKRTSRNTTAQAKDEQEEAQFRNTKKARTTTQAQKAAGKAANDAPQDDVEEVPRKGGRGKKGTQQTVEKKQKTSKASNVEEEKTDAKPKSKPKEGQQEFPQHPYYLIKSEPDAYSFEDLQNEEGQTACWEGVRNHQAKLIMRGMKVGQQAFFYHSNAKPPGIVGVVEVAKEAYPDYYQWDKSSKYYDPKAPKDPPRWWMVDVKYVRSLKRFIPLPELRQHEDKALKGMPLVSKSRLSVQPVSPEHWKFILELEEQVDPADD